MTKQGNVLTNIKWKQITWGIFTVKYKLTFRTYQQHPTLHHYQIKHQNSYLWTQSPITKIETPKNFPSNTIEKYIVNKTIFTQIH